MQSFCHVARLRLAALSQSVSQCLSDGCAAVALVAASAVTAVVQCCCYVACGCVVACHNATHEMTKIVVLGIFFSLL